MSERQQALVLWLNSQDEARAIYEVKELRDGCLLAHTLFPSQLRSMAGVIDADECLFNSRLREANIKRVLGALEEYYAAVWGKPVALSLHVDVSEVVKGNVAATESLLAMLELVFGALVVFGDARATHIERIAQLPIEAQAELKTLVEELSSEISFVARYLTPKACDIEPDNVPVTEVISPEIKDCSVCSDLREMNASLARDLEEIALERCELAVKLREEANLGQRRVFEAEAVIQTRTDELRHLTDLLAEASEKAGILDSLLKAAEAGRAREVEDLREEISVLRVSSDKADKLESTVQRMRDRLEALVDAKQQLTLEVAAHNETFSKLTSLETEVKSLRRLKPQVEEYRDLYRAAQLEVENLEDSLKVADRARLEAEEAHRLVAQSRREQAEEYHRMQGQLSEYSGLVAQTTPMEEDEAKRMTELDPEVHAELETLRARNVEYENLFAQTSTEALEGLTRQLRDQESTNAALQKNWFDTKAAVAAAEAQIRRLEERLAEAEVTKEKLLLHVEELTEAHLEETRDLSLRWEAEKARLQADQSSLEATLERERVALRVVQADRDSMVALKEGIEGLLKSEREETGKLTLRLSAQNEEIAAKAQVILKEYEGKVEEISASFRAASASDNAKFELLLDESKKRQVELEADVDEEKTKRRKVEREKKLVDADLHRYKTQAQTSGSGNVEEVEAAHTELVKMQAELDSVRSELEAIRKGGDERSGVTTRRGRVAEQSTASSMSDVSDKRVEQLTREKRELLAKCLVATNDKRDVEQRLLRSEKEATELRSKLTKLSLDYERLERKKKPLTAENDENSLSWKDT